MSKLSGFADVANHDPDKINDNTNKTKNWLLRINEVSSYIQHCNFLNFSVRCWYAELYSCQINPDF